MKNRLVLIIALLLFSLLNLPANKIKELAGVYVGHRTDSIYNANGDLLHIYYADEIVTIDHDGLVTSYVLFDFFPPGYAWVVEYQLELSKDGTFPLPGSGSGELDLRGNRIEIDWLVPSRFDTSFSTAHFKGHRTKKPIDFPLPIPF